MLLRRRPAPGCRSSLARRVWCGLFTAVRCWRIHSDGRADGFHLGHIKCFDINGRILTQGEYGWGENNRGRSWDRATQSWTYRFIWGEIQVRYVVRADVLDMQVTERNNSGSGVVLDGASIYPLALHLPNGGTTTIIDNQQAPGVTLRDWGTGRVAIVAPDAKKTLYSGLQTGADGSSDVIVSGTLPDALQGARRCARKSGKSR